jgi:hypothetical protein
LVIGGLEESRTTAADLRDHRGHVLTVSRITQIPPNCDEKSRPLLLFRLDPSCPICPERGPTIAVFYSLNMPVGGNDVARIACLSNIPQSTCPDQYFSLSRLRFTVAGCRHLCATFDLPEAILAASMASNTTAHNPLSMDVGGWGYAPDY